MKSDDGSNFFYNVLLGIGGVFHFFGIRSAFKDKKKIDQLSKENADLKEQLEKCQKISK